MDIANLCCLYDAPVPSECQKRYWVEDTYESDDHGDHYFTVQDYKRLRLDDTSSCESGGSPVSELSSVTPAIESILSDSPSGISYQELDAFNEVNINSGAATSPPVRRNFPGTDTCFGTLSVLVVNSQGFSKIAKSTDALLSPFGSRSLQVHSQGEYIGLVEPQQAIKIRNIMTLHPFLELQGFIPKTHLTKLDKLPLLIDVYGLDSKAKEIGKSLSREKLFLQDSPMNKLGLGYNNPHILKVSEEAMRQLEARHGNNLAPPQRIDARIKETKKYVDEVSSLFDSDMVPPYSDEITDVISSRVKTDLLEHQKEALRFMRIKEQPTVSPINMGVWHAIGDEESKKIYYNLISQTRVAAVPTTFRGGILADEMGLGKSLSTLGLIATSLQYDTDSSRRPTLIITPKSTIPGWEDQIQLHTTGLESLSYTSRRSQKPDFNSYDIVLTTYGVVSNEGSDGFITRHKWRRVVLDEAHTIRNRATKQAKAIYRLDAERRWCLSGTPVQNTLDDFGSLMGFLRVAPVDSKAAFNKLITKPLITADGFGSALGKLRILVAATTLRRTKAKTLAAMLPERKDETHFLDFNDAESRVYGLLSKHTNFLIEQTLKKATQGGLAKQGESEKIHHRRKITQLVLRLRQACNHGLDLLPRSLIAELESFEQGNTTSNSSNDLDFLFVVKCETCGTEDEALLDAGSIIQDCQHVFCEGCIRGNEEEVCPICSAAICKDLSDRSSATTPLPSPLDAGENDVVMQDHPQDNEIPNPSTKVRALLQNLRNSPGEKSVVFSCWTKMLDLVEAAMNRDGDIRFERIDGSMPIKERRARLERFRREDDINVLLTTVGSGSVGIDMTVASRVHVLEPQFNPMAEEQALARVHRIGQKKPVVTIRYIISNSYEERIQALQQKKLRLAEICSGGKANNLTVEYLKTLKGILR